MNKIFIDDENKILVLDNFEVSESYLTIKVFGTLPSRIVLVPGRKAKFPQQIEVEIKDGKIDHALAYEIFRKYSDTDDVYFVESEGEYYQYIK